MPQGQVFARGVAGEVLELPTEVGLVEVARRLSELRPVDRTHGVYGQDQSRKAVVPRHPLRGDPDMSFELRGQVIATHPGGIAQCTDWDRAAGTFQTTARLLDHVETERRDLGESDRGSSSNTRSVSMADAMSPIWLRIGPKTCQTASTGTHRFRSSVAGMSMNGEIPQGCLKCTPTSRTGVGYSKRKRLVHTPMSHPSVNTAGGTEGSERHRRRVRQGGEQVC
jgi:hypothetical protein